MALARHLMGFAWDLAGVAEVKLCHEEHEGGKRAAFRSFPSRSLGTSF